MQWSPIDQEYNYQRGSSEECNNKGRDKVSTEICLRNLSSQPLLPWKWFLESSVLVKTRGSFSCESFFHISTLEMQTAVSIHRHAVNVLDDCFDLLGLIAHIASEAQHANRREQQEDAQSIQDWHLESVLFKVLSVLGPVGILEIPWSKDDALDIIDLIYEGDLQQDQLPEPKVTSPNFEINEIFHLLQKEASDGASSPSEMLHLARFLWSTGRSVELRIESMEVEFHEFDPAVEELEFAVKDEMKAFLMEVIKQRLNDGKRDGFQVCPYFRQLLKKQKYGSFYCIICDHMHGFLWYARWPRWPWCSPNGSSTVPLLHISRNRGRPGATGVWRLPHVLTLTKSPQVGQSVSKACRGSQDTQDRVFSRHHYKAAIM